MIRRYLIHTLRASLVLWVILFIAIIISSILYAALTLNGLSDTVGFSCASVALIALLIIGIALTPKSVLKADWRINTETSSRELPAHSKFVRTTSLPPKPTDSSVITSSPSVKAVKPQVAKQVFISYSHRDIKWAKMLQNKLTSLEGGIKINVWTDTHIQPGSKWRDEIAKSLASSSIALILVSPDFLASDFIANYELPSLLEKSKKEGLIVIPILIKHSAFEKTEIGDYQPANDPEKPLATLPSPALDMELDNIVQKIEEAVV